MVTSEDGVRKKELLVKYNGFPCTRKWAATKKTGQHHFHSRLTQHSIGDQIIEPLLLNASCPLLCWPLSWNCLSYGGKSTSTLMCFVSARSPTAQYDLANFTLTPLSNAVGQSSTLDGSRSGVVHNFGRVCLSVCLSVCTG